MGGFLATLPDFHTNVGVIGLIPSSVDRMWIGAKKVEGRWKWENNAKWEYTAWQTGPPPSPSGDGDCVEVMGERRGGSPIGWNDLDCSKHRRAFVCQK